MLDAQVKRMMTDRKAAAFADNFAGQWLEIRNLDSIKPDPQKFPAWTPELQGRDAHRNQHVLPVRADARTGPISDFIDAKYTFLNEHLAKFYGIDGVKGPDFRKVDLTTDQRGGVLARPACSRFPAIPAALRRPSAASTSSTIFLARRRRRRRPTFPRSTIPKVGSEVSLRQQLEAHRNNPVCASCHSKMDVLGFGLENYDAIGKWRTRRRQIPRSIRRHHAERQDPSQTAAEMRAILLASMPQISPLPDREDYDLRPGARHAAYDNRTIDQINQEAGGRRLSRSRR